MLTDAQILDNKNQFIDAIKSISRGGSNIELLVKQLENSDFFEAPASAKYYRAYKGGLCEHSLNVCNNLFKLNESLNLNFNEDSMKIVGLLHDFSRMNFFMSEIKNKKVYSDTGSKHDSMGNFDWVSEMGYAVKEPENRLTIGSHEYSSAFMANTFIPLTLEEQSAISHHHGGNHWDSSKDEISAIFTKYPISMYLMFADMQDEYAKER